MSPAPKSPSSAERRQTTPPFHLKLFYKVGSFHRYDISPLAGFCPKTPNSLLLSPSGPIITFYFADFISSHNSLDDFSPLSPPPSQHLQIYTWPTCTLRELSHLLVSALPSLLPNPAIGTRLAYRLIYPSPQTPPPSAPEGMGRYVSKEIGGVIVSANDDDGSEDADNGGEGIRGIKPTEEESQILGSEGIMTGALGGSPEKTLQDARFVVGDYISCCILPPLPDGSVAPAPPPPAGEGRSGPAPYMNGGVEEEDMVGHRRR